MFFEYRNWNPFFLEEDLLRAIEYEEDFDSFADLQMEEIQKAKEIFDSGNYLELPDRFEINEYKIMEDFCFSLENEFFSKKLQESIQGKGAFKRFKETLYQYDLFNDWNKFKGMALREFVTKWCKDNDLEII